MPNLNITRQGKEAFKDNDRGYDIDYAMRDREFTPAPRIPLDWRAYAVIIGGIVASYVVLFLVYTLWKTIYCWSDNNYIVCNRINTAEPLVMLTFISLPALILSIDALSRVWTRTRMDNAVANRTNVVLNRYGDGTPADLFDRLNKAEMMSLLLAQYAAATNMETAIAESKRYKGVNSLSIHTHNTNTLPDVLDVPNTSDPIDLFAVTGDQSIIQSLINRGLVDRSGNSLYVGSTADGKPHYIELDETGLIALAGQPQVGKSTTATLMLLQLALMTDSIVMVCDKHGKKEKGLLNRLKPIAHTFARCAIEPNEIVDAIDYWFEVGSNRLADDNTRQYPPCFIVIDEFTALVLLDILPPASLHKLLSGAVEFPKVQTHGLIIGHQWTGKLLGVFGASMRRVTTQRIVHRIDPQDAGFLISVSAAKQVLSLPDGVAIFQGASQPAPIEIHVPHIGIRDLEYVARLLPASAPVTIGISNANVSAGTDVSSAAQRAETPIEEAETLDFNDDRMRVAKDLLAKKIDADHYLHSYRVVRTLTGLRMATIVKIANLIGRKKDANL